MPLLLRYWYMLETCRSNGGDVDTIRDAQPPPARQRLCNRNPH